MSIKDISEKIKGIAVGLERKEIYTLAIIILVGFSSFGLGRLSAIEDSRQPIRIEYPEGSPEAVSVSPAVKNSSQFASVVSSQSSGTVVASKNGTKYHLPWCSGAQRISEANKITFSSKAEAEKAGYTPASNCKGL